MIDAVTTRLLETEAKYTSHKMASPFFFSRLQEADFWQLGEDKSGFAHYATPLKPADSNSP